MGFLASACFEVLLFRLIVALALMATPCLAGEFRLVTWNIEWFPGMSPGASGEAAAKHIEDVQRAIAEMNPDILVMQEIRDWEAAQAAVEATGLTVRVVSAFPGRQQVAIASRFPVDSCWAALWEKTGKDDPPRGYAFAVVKMPDDGGSMDAVEVACCR
jgi:endonuclease/exonuclease/phosphatase family metal-dependent hydrolase